MNLKRSLLTASAVTAFMLLSIPSAFADDVDVEIDTTDTDVDVEVETEELPEELAERIETRETVKEAVDNHDYETFSEYFGLDEETFEILAESQDLYEDGQYYESKALLRENDVRTGVWFQKQKQKAKAEADIQEKKDALEEAKELREEGDYEGAKEVLIEAEVKPKFWFKSQPCDCDCES